MSQPSIHPTAVVSPQARLAQDVVVGPYVVIEGYCEIGPRVEVASHVVIQPWVRLAEGVRVGPHSVLGGAPQDLSYQGEETWLEVGANTLIREAVTLHRSTKPGHPTRIGEDCYLMGHVHVGHDCQVGNGVILTQEVALGGHVQVGDYAVIGGLVGVHQFVRIGSRAMIGAISKVSRDIYPFTLADGHPAQHYRLNTLGLRRAGISGERYHSLERAFRALREGQPISSLPGTPEIEQLKGFIAAPSKRGYSGFIRDERQFEG